MARQQYVVPPDGQRFLMNAATDAIDPPSITGVLNWKGKTCNKDVSLSVTFSGRSRWVVSRARGLRLLTA